MDDPPPGNTDTAIELVRSEEPESLSVALGVDVDEHVGGEVVPELGEDRKQLREESRVVRLDVFEAHSLSVVDETASARVAVSSGASDGGRDGDSG